MFELILAALAMQAAPNPCLAADPHAGGPSGCPAWRHLFDVEGRRMYYDPASVRRSGDSFEILHRAVFAEPLRGATGMTILFRFDCARRTIVAVSAVFHDARGARLRDHQPTGATATPQAIPPDAPFNQVRAQFCPRP
jgi:hypothetical protein